MTMQEILTLIGAGYTKEDIDKMMLEAPAAPADNEPTMRDLMQSMAKLTSAIQANAIAQSVVPGGNQGPTAEDAIAQIIRPTFKERSI